MIDLALSGSDAIDWPLLDVRQTERELLRDAWRIQRERERAADDLQAIVDEARAADALADLRRALSTPSREIRFSGGPEPRAGL
jgi:hypothetical protein